MKLFRIATQIANLHGYKNVTVSWFVEKRAQPLFGCDGSLGVGYADVIADYEHTHDTRYSEDAVEELFTKDEADAFVAWLRAHRNGSENTTVEARPLPMANNVMGFGAIPIGGGPNYLPTGEADDYDLPFKVCGFYDARFYKFDKTLPNARRATRGVIINSKGKIEPWYLTDEDSFFEPEPTTPGDLPF